MLRLENWRLELVASFFVFAMVLCPFTLYGTAFIFARAALTGWITIGITGVFFSAVACIVSPIAESWTELKAMRGMPFKDISKRPIVYAE
jgi:hypothetical protein